ncbi:hypothetical protein E4U42_001201 [Claviceps africana]|uniref:non-specific serine/threonine protein kinase n=1 Tax=Claviceps africana TaxID=83212 RepID=A0A8K0NMZ3_9HYPO|nr:hypothetical protein E4U42_001201 [Claviceps africana]
MKDILINDRYRVDYKIGEGGFGLVYAGTDTTTDEEVAIKLTHESGEVEALEYEASTYASLSGSVGIPRMLWYGNECEFQVLVQELLGPTLEDVFNYCYRRFSLKTVLLIADQCIRRIKCIHDKGYVHCDIKPNNLLLGVGRSGNVIYTIDFGIAMDFEESDGRVIRDDRPLGKATQYATINNHKWLDQSRVDDLESLGYVLLYFAHGSLPWHGLKTNTPVNDLCKGLPEAFAQYMSYLRCLQPADKPNYAYLLKLFKTLFVARGFKYDNVYDWTEKRFYELQNCSKATRQRRNM